MTAPCVCTTLTTSIDDAAAWVAHDDAIHARGLVHASIRDWAIEEWVAAGLPHERHLTCTLDVIAPTIWVTEPVQVLYYRLRNAGLPRADNFAALARFVADPPAMQLAEASSDAAIARLVRGLRGGVL